MPTTRRRGAHPNSTSQSTLSFNNRSSRVTKPSIIDPASLVKKPLSEPAESQAVEIASTVTPEPETTELTIRQSPRKTKKRTKSKRSTAEADDAVNSAAERISEAQLKIYWKAEEETRLAPRVHQSALPLHEKILRHFDLSSQYGPCIGIPRLRRWQRAHGLGLNPPLEVLAVLLREEKKGNKERQVGRLAYIDELANGRPVGVVE